jgi:hypothetical protein
MQRVFVRASGDSSKEEFMPHQSKKSVRIVQNVPANDNATPPKPELVQLNISHITQAMPGSGAPPFMLPQFQRRRNVGRTYK